MVPYTIRPGARESVGVLIAFISVYLAKIFLYCLDWLLSWLSVNYQLPFDFTLPLSALGVAFLIWAGFDRFAWKWFGINKLLGIPIIEGTYDVKTFEAKKLLIPERDSTATAEITQTFSQIQITVNREGVYTVLRTARIEPSQGCVIKYSYVQEPLNTKKERDEGFQTLVLQDKQLVGPYFTQGYREGKMIMVPRSP